ncbi:MAG: glycosyltransferase family 2 protein, partial [Thermodesulfobacteriota bacterium]
LHHVYRSISDQVVTINRFSSLSAGGVDSAGGAYVILGLIHAFFKFVECYLLKLGCLDGLAGLVIASNSSWYVFLKHAKAWETSLENRREPD